MNTCTQNFSQNFGDFANDLKNTALRVVGVACAAIGAIGLMLPGIPGTPFLLVAAFCFSAID
ncbi:MAG: DUF454 family protein [Geitlerinemataceae cyanobacterium]